MATVGDMEVQINAALIQHIRELEALVDSYRLTNEALRNALDDRQKQLNAALGSARKLEKQLDAALQEARSAAYDCGTALEQRDKWLSRVKDLEAQIERENDLWVLMLATQETIQLRWHRQKVQSSVKIDAQEILSMSRLTLNATSILQCTLNNVPEHAQSVMKSAMTIDDLRIVRDATSRMVQMLDVEIDLRVSQLPK